LPLIENNLIDSLGIFHIVSFLEREFDVEVLDEELIPEHFGTIGSIARLVESKRERA
jgi:acyl carrier protein